MESSEVTVENLLQKIGELTVLLDLEKKKSEALQIALMNSMGVSENGIQQTLDLGV